jgi:hypothetical protein
MGTPAVHVLDDTQSTGTGSGCIVGAGGLGIGGALNIGGALQVADMATFASRLLVTNNTNSTSTDTGCAVFLDDDLAIGEDLYVGGDVHASSYIDVAGNIVVANDLLTLTGGESGSIAVAGVLDVGGDVTLTGAANFNSGFVVNPAVGDLFDVYFESAPMTVNVTSEGFAATTMSVNVVRIGNMVHFDGKFVATMGATAGIVYVDLGTDFAPSTATGMAIYTADSITPTGGTGWCVVNATTGEAWIYPDMTDISVLFTALAAIEFHLNITYYTTVAP